MQEESGELTSTEQEFIKKLFAKLEKAERKKKPKEVFNDNVEQVLDLVFQETKKKTNPIFKKNVENGYENISKQKDVMLSNLEIQRICKEIMRENKKKEITGEKYPKILNQLDDCRMRLLLTNESPTTQKIQSKSRKPEKILPREIKNTEPSPKNKILKEKTLFPEVVEIAIESKGGVDKSMMKGNRKSRKRQRPSSKKYPTRGRKSKPGSVKKIKKYENVQSKIKHLVKHDRQMPQMERNKIENEMMIKSKDKVNSRTDSKDQGNYRRDFTY